MNTIVSVAAVASASIAEPSIAAPAGEPMPPDPFLAALAAWRAAEKDWLASIAALGKREDELAGDDIAVRDHPRVVAIGAGKRQRIFLSHEQIDAERVSKAQRSAWHAELEADAARLDAEQEGNGVKALRATEERSCIRQMELLCQACRVVPTTLAGAAAFVRFLTDEVLFREHGKPGGDAGERAARQGLATLEDALIALTRAPHAVATPGLPSDAQLMRIKKELERAVAAAEQAHERLRSAEERYAALAVRPAALEFLPATEMLPQPFLPHGRRYEAEDVEKLRRQRERGWDAYYSPWGEMCDLGRKQWQARVDTRAAEIIAAWEAWTAREEEARAQLDIVRLDDRYNAALDALDGLWQQVKPLRARTIEGLRLKARLALFHRKRSAPWEGGDERSYRDDEHEIACDILDDLAPPAPAERAA